jgi:hypothetical protein
MSSSSSSLFYADSASLGNDILKLVSSLNERSNVERNHLSPTSVQCLRSSDTDIKDSLDPKSSGSKRKTVLIPKVDSDNYHLDPDERSQADISSLINSFDFSKRMKQADIYFDTSMSSRTVGRSYSFQCLQLLIDPSAEAAPVR